MIKRGYAFDDIALIPADYTTINSRKDVDTSQIICGQELKLPIISSNMDSVYSPELARETARLGGISCVHRFCDIDTNVKLFQDGIYEDKKPWVSIGVGSTELERAEALIKAGAEVIVLDLANGACELAVRQYQNLKELFNVQIVVGNFSTSNQLNAFVYHAGTVPDAFKLGQGNGCFVAGTRILMYDGSYKNIEDITVHDRIINQFGEIKEVIGTKFSGIKKVLKYKNNLFYKDTFATEDHLHWVVDSYKTQNTSFTSDSTKNISWRRLDDLSKSSLLMPKKINFDLPKSFTFNLDDYSKTRRDYNGFKTTTNISPSYELGYIFGTFLGDGYARIQTFPRKSAGGKVTRNTSGVTKWYFGKNEEDIVEKLNKSLNSVFGINGEVTKKENMIEVTVYKAPISRFFSAFYSNKEKFLDRKFICSNIEYLTGILEGLIDSDGCIEDATNRISFANTSTNLVELFMFCHYMVKGYYPSTSYRKPTVGNLENTEVTNCKPTYHCRGHKNLDNNYLDLYQVNLINKMEAYEIEIPTYDIEIDDTTHSFIANNAIVHNSACITRIKTGIGYPSVTCIQDCNSTGYNLIFDGGIRQSGDLAKALALGCKAVFSGRLFAACKESGAPYERCNKPPGQQTNVFFDKNKNEYVAVTGNKIYRGSASFSSYVTQGKTSSFRAAEGEEYIIPCTGKVEDLMNDLNGGLRSSMTYLDALDLTQYRKNATIINISTSSALEAQAYGKKD